MAVAPTQVRLQVLTHSRKASFQRCRKRDWFTYELGLRPGVDVLPLRFGSAFHDAREQLTVFGIDAALQYVSEVRSLDSFDKAMLRILVMGYWVRWANCDLVAEFLANEEVFNVPIRNPETEAVSRTFAAGGKRDSVVRLHDGRLALFETKTTKDKVDDRYWLQLLIDGQLNHYVLAAKEQGVAFETTVYDVVRKFGSKPRKATPVEKRKYTIATPSKPSRLYADQREFDETPEEYEWRICIEVADHLDEYFYRKEIPRLEYDLDEYRQELWDVAKDIRDCQKHNRWYRTANKFNCQNCSFFPFCSGLEPFDENFTPDGFIKLDPENIHPELGETK